ncbi:MAG: SNF2-related protein [Acidimicrobiales bacterium]
MSAPLEAVLGWLVSLRMSHDDPDIGTSATWLGMIGSLAVQLVAQGRMIPKLKKIGRAEGEGKSNNDDRSSFAVHWAPALMEPDDIVALSNALPLAVTVFRNRQDARAFSQAVLADIVDVIVSAGARRLEVPAAPPEPRTKPEVAEAFLGHINGEPFDAPSRLVPSSADASTNGRAISGAANVKLVLVLEEPDSAGAWHLRVMAPGTGSSLEPVESAMVNSSNTKRKEVKDQLARLETLYPVLLRPGGRRRGEVVLSQDEAWQLMSSIGDTLTAAGFEVRAPQLSRKRSTPALRLTSEEAQESVVGARQLANVRWSVVFDDVELTAAEIQRLAAQARPLVQSNGRWIELDKVDLADAARALAERADATKLTGADMLRHALGLEGSPLLGGITVAGEGWAADLLRSAASVPDDLPTQPEGFKGELRHYQAEALAWLGFLDTAGLGGCLALDMGLGKTPTMLAHLRRSVGSGPALVIAPPAVVGNWASETRKFVPDLRVIVHHGPNRAEGREIAKLGERADVVITTYGTAVRDADDLAKIEWGKTVLDEAQAIKNATSETAQVLRTIPARSRIALTGTPIENGLGDLWSIMDYTNPGLVGNRAQFISQLSPTGASTDGAEGALRALNGILVFRRTKAEPAIAAELPDRIDELDHCSMTPEQIGLYQAVLDTLIKDQAEEGTDRKKGAVLAAITALKQICNHPSAYRDDGGPLEGRSGKLARLNEIVDNVFGAGRAGADLHPLRVVGREAGRVPDQPHRSPDRLLPRRSGPRRP